MILLLCVLFIIKNIQQVNFQRINIDYVKIILSLVFTLLGGTLGAISWWLTLQIFGFRIDLPTISKIQFQSNLAKYIPGYAWQLLGKGFMTIKHGVPEFSSGIAILFEYLLILITGACLAGLILPKDFVDQVFSINLNEFFFWVLRIGSGLFLLVTPLLLKKTELFFIRMGKSVKIHIGKCYELIGLMLITWVINSIGFNYLIRAISTSEFSFSSAIFTLSLTFVIGLLVFIVPGSFGIRESILIVMLGPSLSNQDASIIALLFRVITIFSELLLYGGYQTFANRKFLWRFSKQ